MPRVDDDAALPELESADAHRQRQAIVSVGGVLQRVFLAALALLAALLVTGCRRARGEPSSVVLDPRLAPAQEPATRDDVQQLAQTIYGDQAAFDPKARYRVAARVLSSERYYLGWGADVAPLDLALGWGEMSDPGVDEVLDWGQGFRWYTWSWKKASSFTNGDVAPQSANVHVVPASQNLKRALLALDAGDIVQLQGFLVDIRGPEGQHWRSSLTRADRGGGSCELLYTTELIANERVYY